MHCRHRPRIAEAKLVELPDLIGSVGRVEVKLGELGGHLVEKISRAVSMHCRHRPRIAEAKLVELPDLIGSVGRVELVHHEKHRLARLAQDARDLLIVGVDAGFAVDDEDDDVGLVGGLERLELVHHEKHRLARLAQDARDLLIVGVDAGFAVDDEDDDVGLVGGLERLAADGALERVVTAHLDAARVDEREVDSVPVRFVIRAIARDAAHLVDDRLAGLRDAVHQRGLAHVRTPHDGNDW